MGSTLPPYPEYRPSGLAWLPRVPSHWDVRRNARIFSQRVETGREELPILEVSLRTGVRVREHKSAAIEAKLTVGLNPALPLVAIAAPWPSAVPAGWEVTRLKQVALIGPSRSEAAGGGLDQQVTFLPMERVSTTGRVDSSLRISPGSAIGLTYFGRGDIVVAKITPCFENGKGALLDDIPTDYGFGTTEFFVLRPSSRVTPAFLYRVTASRAFREMGEAAMTGAAGQQRVPLDFVREFLLPLPPLNEQALITAWIDDFEQQVESAERRAEQAIELVREHRERMIADLVFGALDVSAATLPIESTGIDADGVPVDDLDEAEAEPGIDYDEADEALAEADQ